MSVRKVTWKTKKGTTEAWLVAYVDQGGVRRFKNFKHKKNADAYHATVRVDVRHGTHTPPSESPTVEKAAESWIKSVKARGRATTTVDQYEQHIDLHIVPRIGKTKLAQLTPEKVKDFRNQLVVGHSTALAKKVLTSFKSLLKDSNHSHVANGITIELNQDDKLKRTLEVGRDIPTPKEIKRLIDAAKDDKRRALLLTAALTGLRASELRGLQWKDVDLKGGQLSVLQRADRYNKIGPPKSKSSRRVIPLDSDMLIPALTKWKVACPPGDFVFPTGTGAVEHHANMLRGLESIMTAAKLVDKDGAPKYGLHALRHFFASWCINPVERGGRGLRPQVVQKLLGHSSIVMTMDVYGHLFPDESDRSELAAAARRLFA